MAKQNDNSNQGQQSQQSGGQTQQNNNETTKPYRDITPYEERGLNTEETRKKSN